MSRVQVWAIDRKSVELVIANVAAPMEQISAGWWSIESPEQNADLEYFFRLDGTDTLPDPRSKFQPQGVFGPSRLVNFSEFHWHDRGFQACPLSAAVIYEMHVGTFTPKGTFESAIDKLQHLSRLGVTHLELMPVAEFAGHRGWGYDGVFPYAPHHVYGGPRGLTALVDACHQEGIAIILDVVYNHLGPSGNHLAKFGPYFTDRHRTPWGSAINFDSAYSDEVRRFFIDSAIMWLRDYHFDGLRLDAIHAILDSSAFPFLEQLATEVKALEAHLGRHLVLIAESDLNDPRIIQSPEHNGHGFHAQWNDDFHHALHGTLTRENHGYYSDFGKLSDLATVIHQPYLFNGRFSGFRQRSHGRPICQLKGDSFIVYAQNHDQVGNRATGERLGHLLDSERAKIAAGLFILSPYIPMLFQGEEWSASAPFQYFIDFSEDPKLAKAVSEGRRNEFKHFNWADNVPDPQCADTFMRSKLNWNELNETAHDEMLAWYKELLALRRKLPELTDRRLERVQTSVDEEMQWLMIRRDQVVIVVNLAEHASDIRIDEGDYLELVLQSNSNIRISEERIRMPAHSLAVFAPAKKYHECRTDRSEQTSSFDKHRNALQS